MKKIEYMAPEMEIVELKSNVTLRAGSETGGGGVHGKAPMMDDVEEE